MLSAPAATDTPGIDDVEDADLIGVIRHYEVEGLIAVDELPDGGGFVIARSTLVSTNDAAYVEAVGLVCKRGCQRHIHTTFVDHAEVERTPFVGESSIAELWA